MAQTITHAAGCVQVFDQVFTSIATITFPSTASGMPAPLDTSKYTYLQISVFVNVLVGGGNVTLHLLSVLPDGTQLDYYNNGNHTGTFMYHVGPGASINTLIPPLSVFNLTWGGTVTSANVRVVINGYQ